MTPHEQKSPHEQTLSSITNENIMRANQIIKARALRYYDAAVAIILLGAAVYLLGYWFDAEIFPGGPRAYLYPALTILLTAVLSTRLFRLVLGVKSLRYIAVYPSVSLVAVLVVAGAVYWIPFFQSNRQAILNAVGIFAVALAAREIWAGTRKRLVSCKPAVKDRAAWAGWPVDLHWILDEKPIETVSEDHFGYKSLVTRLASMVEQNTCQSFGLTGPHGSGKTSVLNMVAGELRNRSNKHWFEFVGGWGRSGDNVSASVLEAIVRRLHDEGVEALSLLTWPSDYMREILGDSSFLARTLRCCIQSQQDSVAVLQRLDPVLDAINKHMVVVVEDVDRNTSDDGMNTLCHLLDDFRHTRNVSFFFLKSEETNTSIDFHRLCEHTEMMPRIEPDVLAGHLDEIMQAAKEYGANKLLLHSDRLDIKRLVVQRQVGENTSERNITWAALCTLAHTPRSLKHALRRTMRLWAELAGEVDLLELLLWALLREGCPTGYEFLKSNLGELRQLPNDIVVDEKKEGPVRRIREQIEALGLPIAQEQALKVALTILGFKVSVYKDESFYVNMKADLNHKGQNIPMASQSIGNDMPTDYFRRLEAGELGEHELSDQHVLEVITKYVQGCDAVLPGKVAECKMWAEKITQYEGLMPTERVLDLIEEHIRALGKTYGGGARDDSPGFMDLRDLWNRRGDAYEPFRDRLEAILLIALDYSLELSCCIYYWYVDRYSADVEHKVRVRWIEGLRERVEQREGYIGAVLDPEYPWALFHAMRFREEYSAYNTPEEWQWLVPHLLVAMAKVPEQVVPDVAHLLIRDMRGPRGGQGAWFELEEKFLERLCPLPQDRAALASGLLLYAESRPENDSTAFMIRYVKEPLLRYCNGSNADPKAGPDDAP